MPETADETLSYNEISQRATRSAALIMARGVAIRAIGLLGNIVLARLLVPRDFGIVALGAMIVDLGDFLGDGGLASALVREKGTIERETLQSVLGFQLLLTAVIAAIVTGVGVPLGGAGPVAAVMVWSLIFDTYRLPNAILLERQLNYRLVLRVEILEVVIWNAWAVVAVLLGAGVWGIATAQLARAAVAAVLITWKGPTGLIAPRLDLSRIAPLWRFGVKLQAFNVIFMIRNQLGTVGIALVGGLATVGVWSIVVRLTLVITVLLESLWRVSYPAMSRLRELGADTGDVLSRSLSLTVIAVGFLAIPLGGGAPALVPVLFGSKWDAAVNVLPLAALSVVLSGPIMAVLVGFFMAEGNTTPLIRMAVLDTIVLLTVGLGLLAATGVMGIGVGAVAASAVDLAVLATALHSRFQSHVIGQIGRPVTAATLAGGCAWAVASTLGANVFSLVAAAAVGELAYAALLMVISRGAAVESLRILLRIRRPVARAV